MKRAITDAQFTEAVFRHYHGETLEEIAEDFGISANTLKSIKSRKSGEWNRQRKELIHSHLAELTETRQEQTQVETECQQKDFDYISDLLSRFGYFRKIEGYFWQNKGYSREKTAALMLAYADRHKV